MEPSMKNLMIIGTAAAGSISWVIELWAQERYYQWRWEMHPAWWGAWGILMMLMMALFWVLVIVGLFAAVRWLIAKNKNPQVDSALNILRERYARGEINKEEFEDRKKDLTT
jgi:putative membrane protein